MRNNWTKPYKKWLFKHCWLLLLLSSLLLSACSSQGEGEMATQGEPLTRVLPEVHQPIKVGQCAMAQAELYPKGTLSRQQRRNQKEMAANKGANGQQGININNSSSNIILNNTVFSNTLAGIGIGSNASDNLVTNNEAYDNLLDGIYLFSDATRNILQDNYIHHNARHGIYIKSSDNELPSGNEVTRNQIGIYLNTDSPPLISLERNSIYENIEIDIRRGE